MGQGAAWRPGAIATHPGKQSLASPACVRRKNNKSWVFNGWPAICPPARNCKDKEARTFRHSSSAVHGLAPFSQAIVLVILVVGGCVWFSASVPLNSRGPPSAEPQAVLLGDSNPPMQNGVSACGDPANLLSCQWTLPALRSTGLASGLHTPEKSCLTAAKAGECFSYHPPAMSLRRPLRAAFEKMWMIQTSWDEKALEAEARKRSYWKDKVLFWSGSQKPYLDRNISLRMEFHQADFYMLPRAKRLFFFWLRPGTLLAEMVEKQGAPGGRCRIPSNRMQNVASITCSFNPLHRRLTDQREGCLWGGGDLKVSSHPRSSNIEGKIYLILTSPIWQKD